VQRQVGLQDDRQWTESLLLSDAATRQRAVASWSPLATKRRQAGVASPLPDAVAQPADTDEVAAVVRWANETHTRLLPVGGGSNTVGTSEPTDGRPWVAVDLSRLRTVEWDEESLLVHAGAGWPLGELERTLNGHDYTLGQYPGSLELLTVGGAIATDTVGMLAGKYGRFSDITRALTVVLPTGAVVQTSASLLGSAGFDLHRLLIGAEGQLGIVTQATLRLRPTPDARAWAVFTFKSFDDGIDALRLVHRSDAAPSGVALLDFAAVSDWGFAAALSLPPRGALLMLCFEGDELVQTGHYQIAYAICEQVGGVRQDAEWGDRYTEDRRAKPGTDWAANGRPGSVADVFSVSAPYSLLKHVHATMRAALSPLATQLTTRIGWANAEGAALDIAFQAQTTDDPASGIALYTRILDTGFDACREAGGAIAHHGGIGTTRRDYFTRERGPEAVAAWTAIRTALDPNGILGPT
jgi:alkyldihydroxyacetonephosphate synthase